MPLLSITFRTCPHRVNVRIFRHNFVGGKAKILEWRQAGKDLSVPGFPPLVSVALKNSPKEGSSQKPKSVPQQKKESQLQNYRFYIVSERSKRQCDMWSS